MGTDLWKCALMVALYWCPTGRPGHQQYALISHSVMLSWWLTSPCPIFVMLSTRLGNNKYQSLVCLGWDSNCRPSTQEACGLPIPPPHPVCDFSRCAFCAACYLPPLYTHLLCASCQSHRVTSSISLLWALRVLHSRRLSYHTSFLNLKPVSSCKIVRCLISAQAWIWKIKSW